MLNAHMFLGMLLLGPVALKMGSTGYRFVRYYAGNDAYRRKGPPPIELRLLAPFVVVLTVAVFATGVALLLVGPEHRGILGPLHKITFIAWLAVTALHVLGHLVELPRALAARGAPRPQLGRPGRRSRLARPAARVGDRRRADHRLRRRVAVRGLGELPPPRLTARLESARPQRDRAEVPPSRSAATHTA